MGRPRKNLTGKQFGMLTVLSQLPELDSNGKVCWNCKCECGNNIIVRGTNLTAGRTTSCGCKNVSASELQVIRILERLKIPFKKEYIAPGLKDSKPLRIDFFYEVRNMKVAIEIDGIHHFQPTRYNHSGKESDLQKQKLHDQLKNDWCKENGIILIRIPYTKKYTEITLADILPGSKFRVN